MPPPPAGRQQRPCPPACECGASFGSCGLNVGSVGLSPCLLHCRLPRVLSCHCRRHRHLVTNTLPHAHRGGGNTVISVPTIEAVLASNNASQEQRSMPGHAPHSRCPHKRTCCYFLRLEVGFANCKPQSSCQTINSADRFFKLRRVATTGVLALPAYLAAAVDHRDRVRHADAA